MNFLHCVFVTGFNDQNTVENVTEKQPEKGRKKNNTRKEQASGTRKRLSTAVRTEGGKLCTSCFLFTWKEKLQMKSALEDDKPFWLS